MTRYIICTTRYSFINGLHFLGNVKVSIVCLIHKFIGLNFIRICLIGFIDRLALVTSWLQAKTFHASWEVTSLRKLFLSRHVTDGLNSTLFTDLFKLCSVSICGKSNLNATTSSRTNLTLPLTGHRGIHCSLLAGLRGWAGFTTSNFNPLVDIHRGIGSCAQLLLEASARSTIVFERR